MRVDGGCSVGGSSIEASLEIAIAAIGCHSDGRSKNSHLSKRPFHWHTYTNMSESSRDFHILLRFEVQQQQQQQHDDDHHHEINVHASGAHAGRSHDHDRHAPGGRNVCGLISGSASSNVGTDAVCPIAVADGGATVRGV